MTSPGRYFTPLREILPFSLPQRRVRPLTEPNVGFAPTIIDFSRCVRYAYQFDMGIDRRTRQRTAPITQKRGRTYFAHGAVRLLDAGDRNVSARVQGSQVYRVNLAVADGFIDYSCTCPFFTGDLNACKHIWATAMAAELRGCLKKILDADHQRSARSPGDQPSGVPAPIPARRGAQEPSWRSSDCEPYVTR